MMMNTPWKNNDSAFEPMFDETIAVQTPDNKKVTLKTAIFTDGMGEPMSNDMLGTEREDITIVFAQKDWPFVKTLKRGTILLRCDTEKQYAVSEAKLDNCFGWCITAKEK